jgi:hypothetical protein
LFLHQSESLNCDCAVRRPSLLFARFPLCRFDWFLHLSDVSSGQACLDHFGLTTQLLLHDRGSLFGSRQARTIVLWWPCHILANVWSYLIPDFLQNESFHNLFDSQVILMAVPVQTRQTHAHAFSRDYCDVLWVFSMSAKAFQ